MSEEHTTKTPTLLSLSDIIELQNFFMQFERLGHNCEFGIVQRTCSAEPISLLRWNSIKPQNLTRGLKTRFAGISRTGKLVPSEGHKEYILRDLTYATVTLPLWPNPA